MAEFKKGAVPTIRIYLIIFAGIGFLLAGGAEATIIKGIRTGSEQTYIRLVIETDVRLDPRPKTSVSGNTLQLTLSGVEQDGSILKSEAYRNDVVKIGITRDSKGTKIETVLAFNPSRVRTFFLNAPHRFVVDAYRPSAGDAGDPSTGTQKPVSIIEEKDIPPGEAIAQTVTSQNEGSPSPSFSANDTADGSKKDDFQRQLLIFLIAVTSIILIVIIFLMCMDKKQK